MNRTKLTELARRVGAYLIDIVVIFAFFTLTQTIIFTPLRNLFDSQWMTSGILLEIYVILTISLPAWLYFAISESSTWQATVGKRLTGLQVTGMDGHQIGFGRALLRTVIKLLPWESAHLIANLPTSMWIDPQTGALSFAVQIVSQRYWLFAIVYVLLAVYIISVLVTPRNQSVHDLIARTLVNRRGK